MGDGDDVADRALLDEQGRRAPGRRPAPVLVDRDLEPESLTLLDELAGRLQIGRERLLREHVLARRQRLPDERGAHVGVGRDVDDLDLRVAQKLVELSEDRLDAELLADSLRRLRAHVEDADHALAVSPVAGEMSRPDDPAAPDDADAGAVALRERGPVVELSREAAVNRSSRDTDHDLSSIYSKAARRLARPGSLTLDDLCRAHVPRGELRLGDLHPPRRQPVDERLEIVDDPAPDLPERFLHEPGPMR